MKINFKNRKKFRLFFSKLKKSKEKKSVFFYLKNSKNQKQIQIYFQKKTEIKILKIKIKLFFLFHKQESRIISFDKRRVLCLGICW